MRDRSPTGIALLIEGTWATLRRIDCVSLEACYQSHGRAHFIYLGEGDTRRIIASGDSIEAVFENARGHLTEFPALMPDQSTGERTP